jgi:hypothetical protein
MQNPLRQLRLWSGLALGFVIAVVWSVAIFFTFETPAGEMFEKIASYGFGRHGMWGIAPIFAIGTLMFFRRMGASWFFGAWSGLFLGLGFTTALLFLAAASAMPVMRY